MSKSIKASIDEFINELQARIDLFKSSLVSSNVSNNKETIEELKEIVQKYTETTIENLTISEISSISIIDIKRILMLIGRNNEYIEEIIEKLKKGDNSFATYAEFQKLIADYVNEFYSMQKSQSEVITSRILEYERVIALLSEDNTSELVDDIDNLINIMTSVNLSNEVKSDILIYIANKNATNFAIKLDSNMKLLLANILPNPNSKEFKIISNFNIDDELGIDDIPSVASDISKETDLSYVDTYNALIGYILYKQSNKFFNTENITLKLNIKGRIISLIQCIIGIEQVIVEESSQIVDDYADILDNLIQEGYENFKEYGEATLDELSSKYGSLEIAIQLKKCVIIRYMMDYIKKFKEYSLKDMTEEEETEYYIILDKLSELKYIMDNYNEMEKKDLEKVKE